MSRSRAFDPPVYVSKTNFMQRVQEAAGDGYCYYTLGNVGAGSVLKLVRKFKSAYSIDADKNERYRRKRDGLGNARLLLRWSEADGMDFALLVSPGAHPAQQLEKLKDLRTEHLTYREFELIRLTAPGRMKPSLTWRWSKETVEAWRTRLHLCTAHNNKKDIFQSWRSLYRTPGFAGIRKQVGELVSYWRKEWGMLRGDTPCPMSFPHSDLEYRPRSGIRKGEDGMFWTLKGFPSPVQCPKLFYIRKQADIATRLSHLLKSLSD